MARAHTHSEACVRTARKRHGSTGYVSDSYPFAWDGAWLGRDRMRQRFAPGLLLEVLIRRAALLASRFEVGIKTIYSLRDIISARKPGTVTSLVRVLQPTAQCRTVPLGAAWPGLEVNGKRGRSLTSRQQSMQKNQVDLLQAAALCFFLAFIMTRNPNCNRGCRTLAEHLVSHGVDDVLAALF